MPPQTATVRPSFTTASGGRVSGQTAFKPPRPRMASDAAETLGSAAKPSATRAKPTAAAAAAAAAFSAAATADAADAMEISDDEDGGPSIPPALLTRVLHQFFVKPGTRITQDANASVARYMDLFTREAVARSMQEKRDGGLLDVDVLQKVAVQLVTDM